jgi:Na+/serine symporter
MFGNSYAGLNPDEIEVRVWAFVVKAVTILVLGIAFGVLYAIAFEEQAETLAPIDAVFLEILKAVAFMGVGTLGGISGRKAVASYAEKKAADQEPQ